MTLTREKLALDLNICVGLSKEEGKDFVRAFFDEIAAALEAGEDVTIPNFGKFVVLEKGARPGRNPKTGAEVIIAPRKSLSFRASNKLKHIVAQYHDPRD